MTGRGFMRAAMVGVAIFRSDWRYTAGLAYLLDEPGEGYIRPRDAVLVDLDYWERD